MPSGSPSQDSTQGGRLTQDCAGSRIARRLRPGLRLGVAPFQGSEHRSGARSAREQSVPFSLVGALPQRGFPSQADPSLSPVRATTPKRSPGYRRRAPARRQTLGCGVPGSLSPEGTVCSVVDHKGDSLASAGDVDRIVPTGLRARGAAHPGLCRLAYHSPASSWATSGSGALSGLGSIEVERDQPASIPSPFRRSARSRRDGSAAEGLPLPFALISESSTLRAPQGRPS